MAPHEKIIQHGITRNMEIISSEDAAKNQHKINFSEIFRTNVLKYSRGNMGHTVINFVYGSIFRSLLFVA